MKRITVLVSTLAVLSACTLGGPPYVPTGLTASTDLHNKIELAWDEDPNAGVYHVFRGETAGLTDEDYIGSTAMNAFIDIEVETDVTYWYAVSAADPFGNNETPLSEEVSGVAPDLVWSPPATISENSAAAVLAAGGTNPAVITADATGGAMTWYEYDEEAGWTAATESPGTAADAAVVAASVIGGDLHVAFTDANAADALTVRSYTGEEDGWETLGEADTIATVSGPISLAGSGSFLNPEVYLGYLNGTAAAAKYYPNAVAEWADLGTLDPPVTATTVRLLVFGGNTYIIYEDAGPSLAGQVYEDPAGWTALPDSGVTDITDGYLAVAAGTDSIYLAYSDAADTDTLSFLEYSAGAWYDLGSISGVEISGPLDLAVLDGVLYAAYVTATSTVVSRYVDEAWEITANNPDVDTPAAAEDLDLGLHGGTLRLLTVSGGILEVRAFE